MTYSLLDAYNTMRRANSEKPLNSFEDSKRLGTSNVVSILSAVLKEELRKGNAFNTSQQELVPTTDGVITLAPGMMSVYFPASLRGRVVLRNNNTLWDVITNTAYTEKITLLVVQEQSFEECPEVFQEMIAYKAAIEYYSSYGPGPGTPQYMRLEQKSRRANCSFFNSEFYKIPSRYELLYAMQMTGNQGGLVAGGF